MLFRYDFGEKLDLTKFNIQAKHYIGKMRQIEYHLVLSHYKLIINIDTPDDVNSHLVSAKLSALKRDKDNGIIGETLVFPATDIRFQDFKIIKEVWKNPSDLFGAWTSDNTASTVKKIADIIKIIHKINNLRVFI